MDNTKDLLDSYEQLYEHFRKLSPENRRLVLEKAKLLAIEQKTKNESN